MAVCLGSHALALVGAHQGHQPVRAVTALPVYPSFHLVADRELGRLILLSSDTSETDLEFTASGITKH